jgi:DNA-binding helix-hairpin-helix protein with protein kinase domain
MPVTYDSTGRKISLASLVGKGGEGSVFSIHDDPSVLAKLYHSPAAPRERKISAMVKLASRQLLSVASWPIQTLHPAPNAPIHGFLMRRAPGVAIHSLYSPKSRLGTFPLVTWHLLIRASTNLARAAATIHQHGHLIGDINHANCFITEQATVRLIDCDSFQVTSGGEVFPCLVGTDCFTPPELQRARFGQVIRTQNHDAFGLAVLIFYLLFNGRHPFAGKYLGSGDMPIQKAIAEYRFAYGSNARAHLMESPPHALSLDAISPAAAELFERAFSQEAPHSNSRPTAMEWITTLNDLASALRTCKANSAHFFAEQLSTCPWCDIERGAHVLLYYLNVGSATVRGRFNLTLTWTQIERVPPPIPLAPIPNPQARKVMVSANVRQIVRTWRAWLGVSLGVFAVLILALPGWWFVWAIAVVVIPLLLHGPKTAKQQELTRLREQQLSHWSSLQQRYTDEAMKRDFEAKLADLRRNKDDLCGLADEREKELAKLQQNAWWRQLYWFLNRYYLRDASIAGVGPGKLAVLRSYGVETAADVNQASVSRVPGFGLVLTGKLMAWRQSLERGFRFDASRSTDPSDVADLDRKLDLKRRQLEATLTQGQPQLLHVNRQVNARRADLRTSLESAAQALAQTDCDLRALGSLPASYASPQPARSMIRPTWHPPVRTSSYRRRPTRRRSYKRRS